jgi:aspartate/methionine/tyrosine aminotransferase
MKIIPFGTEDYYARYEFTSPHMLSNSDCESTSIAKLIELSGRSMDGLGATTLGYTESKGHPDLRRAIAAGADNVSADNVLVLNAPIEGIFVAMSAVLTPDDRAVVLGPCYDALRNLPTHVCGNVDMWMLQETDTGWALDFDRLDELLAPPTKILVVNFPHNPTGFLPTVEEFSRIIEMARSRGVWLFSDEMYRGLEPDGNPLPTAAELYEKSIVLSGLSKSFGLPGLRSGWLVVRDQPMFDRMLNWKYYTSICPPAPIEFLALAAFEAREQLWSANRKRVRDNLALAQEFFARFDALFEWRAPIAGPVALVGIDVASASDYCHRLAQEAGVVLLPSSFLSYGDGHVRFGFGRDGFGEALEQLERYLRTQA